MNIIKLNNNLIKYDKTKIINNMNKINDKE
jgi:hypothetical protein